MCGIFGIIKKNGEEVEASQMQLLGSVLSHRGPDNAGFYQKGSQAFGNVRLSIVDVKGGNMPIYNDTGEIGIVYNGEVYNHNSLRADLEARGCHFKSNSDTEVVLKGYEAYGSAIFEKLNGMFACCIWDNGKDVVYLARDHLGIKPMYIYEDGKELIFSSELKGLLALPDVNLALDPVGFQDYLIFRYIQAPKTFFKNIRKLEAGTYLEIKKGQAVAYRYWEVNYKDTYPLPDVSELEQELLKKLDKAVMSQLMGEVPVGVLLSGGVDSSTIAYFVSKHGAHLKTYNIGFPQVNEFKYSREVAKLLGLEHVEVTTTCEELINIFSQVSLALDEPIADPACLPLYQLCKELKKSVTVVLSGEGGDELFAGYPQYKALLRGSDPYSLRWFKFLEKSWYFTDNFREFLRPNIASSLYMRNWKYFDEQPLVNGMLAYDVKTWLPENLMMKADKILMAHSLEGRFPFLDKEIFQLAANLPQIYKLHQKEIGKWILKKVMHKNLPANIINRPKMGFTVPVTDMLDRMEGMVLETLLKLKDSPVNEIIDVDNALKFGKNYYKNKEGSDLQLWNLFVMAYWFVYSLPAYRNAKYSLLPSRKQ